VNSRIKSRADTEGAKVIRQAILSRSHTLWGNEFSVVGTAPGEQPDNAYCEALRHISRRHTPTQAASHTFLRIDQTALMSEATLTQLTQAARDLEKHQQHLTLSIDNPLDALPGPVERRAMVRQLYKLKDQSGIKLAYNNYTLDTKPCDLLIDLTLYDYIKMPFPDSALRLSLNTRSDLFDRLYDRMLELINVTRVCFIADHIEFSDSAMLARNLPFEYFQGGYYSPADRL
jgi:EAL domain-containing protein (putative c-di-GMP-specific phosphodiesterase class I)